MCETLIRKRALNGRLATYLGGNSQSGRYTCWKENMASRFVFFWGWEGYKSNNKKQNPARRIELMLRLSKLCQQGQQSLPQRNWKWNDANGHCVNNTPMFRANSSFCDVCIDVVQPGKLDFKTLDCLASRCLVHREIAQELNTS